MNDLFVLNPFINLSRRFSRPDLASELLTVLYYCRYTSRSFLRRLAILYFLADQMKDSIQSFVQEVLVHIFFFVPASPFLLLPDVFFRNSSRIFFLWSLLKSWSRRASSYFDSLYPARGLFGQRFSVFSVVDKGILPKSIILATGGLAVGDISIKSKFALQRFLTSASALAKLRNFSPSGPITLNSSSHYLIIYPWFLINTILLNLFLNCKPNYFFIFPLLSRYPEFWLEIPLYPRWRKWGCPRDSCSWALWPRPAELPCSTLAEVMK